VCAHVHVRCRSGELDVVMRAPTGRVLHLRGRWLVVRIATLDEFIRVVPGRTVGGVEALRQLDGDCGIGQVLRSVGSVRGHVCKMFVDDDPHNFKSRQKVSCGCAAQLHALVCTHGVIMLLLHISFKNMRIK
jgi:hypothetical protein